LSGNSPYKVFYGYDSYGHTTYEGVPIGSQNYETRYGYDGQGRLRDLNFPLHTGDGAHFNYDLPDLPADAEQITGIDDYFNGSLWMSFVTRIEHSPDGLANNIWFNELGGSQPALASVTRSQNSDRTIHTVGWRSGSNTTNDIASQTYAYRQDGLIASIASGSSSTDNYYDYDHLGHLSCAAGTTPCLSSSSPIATYSYDPGGNGNRGTSLVQSAGAGNHSYDYIGGSNLLGDWSRPDWAYPVYQGYGSPSSSGTGAAPGQRIYDYDYNSGDYRLLSYFHSGLVRQVAVYDGRGSGTTATYGYDHRGRRVYGFYRTPSGSEIDRYFFYDQRDRLIAVQEVPVTPAGNSVQELYYWNETEPMARFVLQNTTNLMERTYFYNDHLGTPRVAVGVGWTTPIAPTVIYRAPRAPFMEGAPVISPPSAFRPVRLRFAGQWVEDGTGIYSAPGSLLDPQLGDLALNGARAYDPGVGGYVSSDPALLGRRSPSIRPLLPYGYALGTPTRFRDPSGLEVPYDDPYGVFRAIDDWLGGRGQDAVLNDNVAFGITANANFAAGGGKDIAISLIWTRFGPDEGIHLFVTPSDVAGAGYGATISCLFGLGPHYATWTGPSMSYSGAIGPVDLSYSPPDSNSFVSFTVGLGPGIRSYGRLDSTTMRVPVREIADSLVDSLMR
jgi:RHS repeat-associated protein